MTVPSTSEKRFFNDISKILQEGRKKVHIAVNFGMVETYWNIGRRIVEEEQQGKERANYGEFLIINLSRYLGDKFGRGFSIANLKNFKKFYLALKDAKGYTLCNLLSWSHIRLIIRIDNKKAREYYANETITQKWSVRVLERNIHSGYYERLLSSQKPMLSTAKNKKKLATEDVIKDPYVLEFLGLPENTIKKEKHLESSIINHLQDFLLEMGRGFSFIGRQFRISTETTHFYIDLVFYNYLLKCFVIIDLKTKKLTHQDIGQMDMYVQMFDDLKRGEDDNPTIGIILCADKDETIARYSVLSKGQQMFASKYKLVLPTEEELAEELERNTHYLREIQSSKDGI